MSMQRVLFCLLMTLVLLLAACGSTGESDIPTPATVPPEYDGKTNPLGTEAAVSGADVFKTNCETCHGPEGHGDGPAGQVLEPKPKNLADVQAVAPDDYLFWRISEGKPGTAMIAWKGILTEEQIWQAVSFIRTLR
jgi:mono/diheme cytochrome c family protein